MVLVEKWGTYDDKDVMLYTLFAGQYEVKISNYGATLTHFYITDYSGIRDDIVLGFDNLSDYINKSPYFGATVGRFANRIAGGKFTIDDKNYQLSLNEADKHHLHGGFKGLDKKVWQVHLPENEDDSYQEIVLTTSLEDKEEGYPGNMNVQVLYRLYNDGRLLFDVQAKSDQDTICNIINHSYFNLNGSGDVLEHELWVDAPFYTKTNNELICTGEILTTNNTYLDFTNTVKIGDAVSRTTSGVIDNNLIFSGKLNKKQAVARLSYDKKNRYLDVYTSLPAIQLYNSHNISHMDIVGKNGESYSDYAGICLETQLFPNSPNYAHFSEANIKKDELWHNWTVYHLYDKHEN